MRVEENDVVQDDGLEDETETVETVEVSTDNVGDPSVEINVEELISEHPPEPAPALDAGAPAAIEDAGPPPERAPQGPAHVSAGLETWRIWVLDGGFETLLEPSLVDLNTKGGLPQLFQFQRAMVAALTPEGFLWEEPAAADAN